MEEKSQTASVNVVLWYEGKPLRCGGFYDEKQNFWAIQQLAFFMSHLRLGQGDHSYPTALLPSRWQSSQTVLIRPALPPCDSSSMMSHGEAQGEAHNSSLIFTSYLSLFEADTLAFEVSVPFALNHQNPLTQPSPLNLPAMFWSWRRGHKFLRVDLQSAQGAWAFHLGSLGCEAASSMRGPTLPCKQGNRFGFTLSKIAQGKVLILHLDRLIQGISLKPATSCVFHPASADSCEQLLGNMNSDPIFEWY